MRYFILPFSFIYFFVLQPLQGQYIIDATSDLRLKSNLSIWQVSDYKIFSADTRSWLNFNTEHGKAYSLQILLDSESLNFFLEETILFDNESLLYVINHEGKSVVNNYSDLKSFKGTTKDGKSRIRLTIAEGFLYGSVVSGDDEYFIEPLKYYDQSQEEDVFIFYHKRDVAQSKKVKQCFRPIEIQEEFDRDTKIWNRTGLCYRTNLAMFADYSMFIDPSHSGVQAVVNHIVGVINNVEDNFEYNGNINFNDGVNFHLSEIVISTCPTCDPISAQSNAGLLLSEFSSWVDQGGFNHSFHGAQLWTDRDLDGSAIGVAFQNANLYCQSKGRAVFQDWTTNAALLKIAVSHEMGHTFNAVHDASNSSSIMAPSISSNNTIWSPSSKTTISNQIALQGQTCLSACGTSSCPPIQNIVIDSITNTNIFLSWSPSSSGLYTIKVREVGQENFLMEFNTSALNVALAPSGYTVCKKYDIFVYNNCNASGLSLPERLYVIAPTSQGCADFAANKTVVWPGVSITFSDKSLNATSWLWNFGNGQSSTLQHPTVTYTAAGVYNVTLTVNGINTKVYNNYIKVLEDRMPPFGLNQGGDFESNSNCFASSALDGNTDFWQLGTSNYVLVTNGNAWKTGLNTDITPVTTKSALYSPRFNFMGYQNFELHFDIGMEVQFCNAPIAGQLQYSINNGSSWNRLGNSPGFYNAGAGASCKIASIIFPDTTGWTFNANYLHKSIDLSFLAGQPSVIFRFVLGVSGFYNGGYAVDGILIDNFTIEASGSVPLAIDESGLIANIRDNKTILLWNLNQHEDIERFVILRSGDDLVFKEIGIMERKNHVNAEFVFEDCQPLRGNNYYKVGAVHINGNTNFTNIVNVKHTFNEVLSVLPNPAKGDQEIGFELNGNLSRISDIKFFDMLGRLVDAKIMDKSDNKWIIALNSAGVYVGHCFTDSGNILSAVLIIK